MLVLERDANEAVVIQTQPQVKVWVLEIRGPHVRLGFEAPLEVRIDREEIFLLRQSQEVQGDHED